MSDVLNGWDEIAKYLKIHRRTAQHYVKARGLQIHHLPGGGSKPPVFAITSELDKWRGRIDPAIDDRELNAEIAQRAIALSLTRNLYRKNFVTRFTLQPSGTGVSGRVETEYQIINESGERQAYAQEITIDDCEAGYLETMSVSVNGKQISSSKRPKISERQRGYVSYKSPMLLIDPTSSGKVYIGKATWIIQRKENDFWYLHVGIPTFGIRVETAAPPEFEITPSFSTTSLLTIGQHIDIVWKKCRGESQSSGLNSRR